MQSPANTPQGKSLSQLKEERAEIELRISKLIVAVESTHDRRAISSLNRAKARLSKIDLKIEEFDQSEVLDPDSNALLRAEASGISQELLENLKAHLEMLPETFAERISEERGRVARFREVQTENSGDSHDRKKRRPKVKSGWQASMAKYYLQQFDSDEEGSIQNEIVFPLTRPNPLKEGNDGNRALIIDLDKAESVLEHFSLKDGVDYSDDDLERFARAFIDIRYIVFSVYPSRRDNSGDKITKPEVRRFDARSEYLLQAIRDEQGYRRSLRVKRASSSQDAESRLRSNRPAEQQGRGLSAAKADAEKAKV